MDFYRRAALVCQKIPLGRVTSYGHIALLCGFPRNARQVGRGLSRGLLGEVPAHRVVNSKGELSGAAAFGGPEVQKVLLEAEGVEVSCTDGLQRVSHKRFAWRTSLEEAQELKRLFEKIGI